MTSKDIYKQAKEYFGRDIVINNKRENVYARAITNVLCREYTKESLEQIGKNSNRDHATVLNSIKAFNEIYTYQVNPFNVFVEYKILHGIIGKINIELDREVLDYGTLNKKYYDLLIKHKSLMIHHEETKEELGKLRLIKQSEDRIRPFFNVLSGFNNEEIRLLIETRIKPFKKLLESKKTYETNS